MRVKDGGGVSFRVRVKRLLPRSLFARFVLILLLPVVLAQSVAMVIFFDRHWDNLNNRLSFGVAGEIALAVAIVEERPLIGDAAVWARLEEIGRYTLLDFHIRATGDLPAESATGGMINSSLDAMLNGALKRQRYPYVIIDREAERLREVQVETSQGILVVEIPQRRLSSPTAFVFLLWMVGSAVVFLLVALLFMRNQVRPILRLARVAESFGKGQDVERFKPEGALEVRAVSQAFLVMRERINRQIKQRTEMLAGVSHDLRTPLTRMKLQLAMMPQNEEWVRELVADVAEMAQMVEGYLAFARGENGEETSAADLVEMIEGVVERVARQSGKDVTFVASMDKCVLDVRPQAVRRCLENLVGNAVRYGEVVRVTLEEAGTAVFIYVDDNGPGIPPEKMGDVIRPFVRLEGSRNQDTGGVGLGLTIASDVARGHGGDLKLAVSPMGGLRASVRLPK